MPTATSKPDDGGRIDHGTMFGYAVREGLIDPRKSVQIGIRTTFTGETTMGFRIVYADEVHDSTQRPSGRNHHEAGRQDRKPISPSTSIASILPRHPAPARPFRAA